MEEINIFIDNFDDIFNQFDKSDISDELALFIENRCSRIKKNELVIYIHTKIELNSTDKELIVAAIRKHFAEYPEHFDPRKYLIPAREAIYKMVSEKIVNIFGSNDKAI